MAGTLLVTPILVRGGRLQQSTAPFIASFQGRGAHQGVRFHALAETPAADPGPLCQRLLATFQRSLAGAGRSSLTTAMGQALQESHQELRSANEKLPLARRVGAGMTCLALRGDEVYVAQAGPGLLYLRDSTGVRTVSPLAPGGAQQSGGPRLLGLGEGEALVLLDRHTLGAGQVLLAAHSSLSTAVTYDSLVAVLSSPPQDAPGKFPLLLPEEAVLAALQVSVVR